MILAKLNKGYLPSEPVMLKRLYNFYDSCVDFGKKNNY